MYWTCKWTNIEQTELKFCLHLPPFPFQECTLVAPSLAKDSMPGNGSPRNSIALYPLDLCLNSVAYLKINVSIAVFLVTLIPLSLSRLHG